MRFGRSGLLVLRFTSIVCTIVFTIVFIAAAPVLRAAEAPAEAVPAASPLPEEPPREGFFRRAGKFVGLGRSRDVEPPAEATPAAPTSAAPAASTSSAPVTSATPASPGVVPAPQEAQQEAPKDGFLGRTGKFFGLGGSKEAEQSEPKEQPQKSRKSDGLTLRVESPVGAIRLSDSRNLPVRITLKNEGKKSVILKFDTSQKIEIVVKDIAGAPVVRWSEDRAFAQVRSRLLLNTDERAEYDESISLRDLGAGKNYVLEVTVVGYPDLNYSVPFTPAK